MTTWDGAPQPPAVRPGVRGWLRIARRGMPALAAIALGLVVLLALRLPERLAFGARRPVTPWITRGVCAVALRLVGLRRIVRGRAVAGPGALVANHASWLDILALNACAPMRFVSKAEVGGWPGIGWLARATGTVFIRRDRRLAATHRDALGEALAGGGLLALFPEGTSSDGCRVLPFKSTLFAALATPDRPVQPVTLRYVAPPGSPRDLYGWWGDRDLAGSLVAVLSTRRRGRVEVTFHPPLDPADHPDRKALARAAEAAVRGGLDPHGGGEDA